MVLISFTLVNLFEAGYTSCMQINDIYCLAYDFVAPHFASPSRNMRTQIIPSPPCSFSHSLLFEFKRARARTHTHTNSRIHYQVVDQEQEATSPSSPITSASPTRSGSIGYDSVTGDSEGDDESVSGRKKRTERKKSLGWGDNKPPPLQYKPWYRVFTW